MNDKSISITEIARLAGVHPSTVSRALNDSPLVKEETKAWIRELADKHGYIPDALAKSLIHGKTYTIGVIVPEISSTFYSHIVDAIDSAMTSYGYHLLLCNSRFDQQTEYNAVQTLLGRRVDALIVCTPVSPDALRPVADKIPVIFCDATEEFEAFDCVSVDEKAGMSAAVKHLIQRGHRKIGCIADNVTGRRSTLFRDILLENGLAVNEDYFIQNDLMGVVSGYQAIHSLAAQNALPTAIFTTRDHIAVGAMRAAIELGIQIPDQLAIVGYDDLRISSFLYKNLTTIRQPADKIGQTASSCLLYRLGHAKALPPVRCLSTELIVRETT